MRTIELSVVIPVYNEGPHIANSLSVINHFVSDTVLDYEIVIVVDGSTDNTWEEVSRYAGINSNVRVLRLSRNFGKEMALCAGLDHAQGQAVIIMDADLQHPPELIQQMVALWRKLVFSVVIGLQTVYNKIYGVTNSGATTIIILQLFVGSILMISLGIIGEYMASIYIHYLIGQTATVLVIPLFNFLFNHLWVFRNNETLETKDSAV
jgi:glycosyltransferase involved in cell wall biosynthesis